MGRIDLIDVRRDEDDYGFAALRGDVGNPGTRQVPAPPAKGGAGSPVSALPGSSGSSGATPPGPSLGSPVDSPLTARTAGDSIVRRATVECIAVVGNRQGADLSQVLDFIVALHARQPNSLLVSGGADGVDAFAESTWFRLGGRIRSFRPAPYADGFGVEVWNYGGKQPAEVLSVEHHGVQADDYRSAALYRDTLIAEGCDRLVAFYRAGLVWNTGTHFTESWARDRGVPTYSFVAAAGGNTDVA